MQDTTTTTPEQDYLAGVAEHAKPSASPYDPALTSMWHLGKRAGYLERWAEELGRDFEADLRAAKARVTAG